MQFSQQCHWTIDLNSIRNFVQLTDNFATAGQPAEWEFAAIANHGYQHVINLAMPDHPDSIANEGALVAELGMSYLHIPVPFDKPQKRQVSHFCRYLDQVKHDEVFIHCHHELPSNRVYVSLSDQVCGTVRCGCAFAYV